MPHDAQKYLYDIQNSCDFLLDFTAGRTVDDYTGDRAFRSAVERELQIIGEAVRQLNRAAPHVAAGISEHQNIIAFRHVLVHGYDSLQPDTVWNVIEVKLAVLRAEVENLLKQLGARETGGCPW
jgi:uncharacterized protein with HEPN domain